MNNRIYTDSRVIKTISKLKKLKYKLKNLLNETTIHGIPRILKTERLFSKLIWLVFFLASSFGCFYTISKTIERYLEFDFVTTIKTYAENIVQFPAISICNCDDTNFTFEIVDLEFGFHNLKNWKKHFEPYNDSLYGQCYRFNSGRNYTGNIVPIKSNSDFGLAYGFWIQLFVNTTTDFGQFKVYIHNQSTRSIHLYNKGYYISTGIYNYFLLDRVYEKKLEEPYNLCLKNPTLFKGNKTLIEYISQNNKVYSQKYCFELCRSIKYMEENECNCTLDSLEDDVYVKCLLWQDEEKAKKINHCVYNYELKLQRRIQDLCSKYCPLECDSFEYKINFFTQSIPTNGKTKDKLTQFDTYVNASRNYLSIFVYYEDTKYTLISQYPKMQLFDLLSSIGGIFGLFLGMGLLSFVEIFEFISEVFFVIFE